VDDDFGLQGPVDRATVGDFHQTSALSVIDFAKQFDRLVDTAKAAVFGFTVFAILRVNTGMFERHVDLLP